MCFRVKIPIYINSKYMGEIMYYDKKKYNYI